LSSTNAVDAQDSPLTTQANELRRFVVENNNVLD
jgi:hypothetical protein